MARQWPGLRLAVALVLAAGPARADDPKLVPGRDPGGVAVAILANGFDYTRADVAHGLARDGEGEAIAWDAVDRDHRPFARDGSGTVTMLTATAHGGVRVVPVRVAPGDAASLAKGVAFAASTPARLVLVTFAERDRSGLAVMVAAAKRFAGHLFVASLPGPAEDEVKAGEGAENLVIFDSKEKPHAAAEALARALGCRRGEFSGASGGDLKRAFLNRLGAEAPAACRPEGAQSE